MNKDIAHLLEEHFEAVFSSPSGINKLRELILTLAMQGKLVPQNISDPPASELLNEVEAEKQRLADRGSTKKSRSSLQITEEEKPYKLPRGWEWVRLGDIGIINPRNDIDKNVNAGFVPMPLIHEGFSEIHSFEERPWNEIKKGYTHFANGDVGMAKITPCFENAKSCVFYGLPNEVGAGTTELHVFRNAFRAVEPRFLLFFLKNPKFITEVAAKMTGSAGQKRVPTPVFAGLILPLPPKPEQKRIVTKIDQLMTLCGLLEKKIDEATLKQAELLNAVVRTASIETFKDKINLAEYRAAVGCYSVEKLGNTQYFGRTAAAKVIYLAQAHLGLKLNLKPEREAAGPLDTWIYEFERQGQTQAWFEVNEKTLALDRKKVEYRALPALAQQAEKAKSLMSAEQLAEFDRLIYALADKKTEEVEIIATLFAVWNDFLIDGIQPKDDQIIAEMRDNWHPRKARFTPAQLRPWLAWLRKEKFVPQGRPPRTVQQSTLPFAVPA